MPFKRAPRTKKALDLIGKPRPDGKAHTPYSAAKACKVSLATIYRHAKPNVTLRYPVRGVSWTHASMKPHLSPATVLVAIRNEEGEWVLGAEPLLFEEGKFKSEDGRYATDINFYWMLECDLVAVLEGKK